MSTQYPGGFITKSPVAPTSTAASGIWTVDQALQYVKAGTWPSPPIFIEDLFSTWLYTGDGTNDRVITNNINISGNGGMVMTAPRSTGNFWSVADTARGAANWIYTNSDGAQQNGTDRYGSFTTTGYTLGSSSANSYINGSGTTYVSWTFAKQPKFFDVVTYTGNGVAGRTVSHSLGSVPGCIIIKKTSAAGSDWITYHRGLASPAGSFMNLNLTQAVVASTTIWNNTAPTSSVFSLGSNTPVNGSGVSYVAYLFAHDAGGFPANGGGSTNGISCGSFTTTAGGIGTVTLGYEPQWVLIKNTTTGGAGYDWFLLDSMRGMTSPPTAGGAALRPNTTDAEATGQDYIQATSTGFVVNNNPSSNYIYIAIRRGPMKTPTVGTSVFSPNAYAGGTAGQSFSLGFVPDTLLTMRRNTSNFDILQSRLVGQDYGFTNTTDAFTGGQAGIPLWSAPTNTISLSTATAVTGWNASGSTYVNEAFARAPGFFDVVCYTGTGAVATQSHNLGVVPEMMIVKKRSVAADWEVYHSALGPTKVIELNLTGSESTSSTRWNNTAPTASVFTIGTHTTVNASGATYVAYLFATLAGISKVGSYTGTAALQTVACGFTTGVRFVLIKRSDAGSTGDWYVWDSARGISSSTDPYTLLNSTAAEDTTTNYVDTDTTGFKVTAAASTTVNVSAATYIFLAIA